MVNAKYNYENSFNGMLKFTFKSEPERGERYVVMYVIQEKHLRKEKKAFDETGNLRLGAGERDPFLFPI